MAETTKIIQSAGTHAQQLVSRIENRPSLDLQAQSLISTLNRLLQALSDLQDSRNGANTAEQLQLTMKPVYIAPVEGLISADLQMLKMGPLNRAKTIPDTGLKQEIETARLLVGDLRLLLSRLGGMVFVPDPMPPGPVWAGGNDA